ncbi:Melanization protease 1, partial [Gonioctena quinquepunctata]
YIKPICLPSVTFQMKTNETLTVAGWGRTSATGTEKFSPVLKKAKLPKVKKEDCSQHGRNLTDGQICAGLGNGIDTCTGDSGGPLILERAQNYEFVAYQIGVISYGFAAEGCGNAPSVNTYVPHYIDWIVKNIS